MFKTIEECRSCGSRQLTPVISLGETPIADRLLTNDQLEQPTTRIPLDVVFCSSCTLLQIKQTVEPEVLFCQDYPYFSSVSPKLLQHFKNSALSIIDQRKLGPNSLVVEAASNDGYMLRNFKDRGIPVLGIDPASAQADKAEESGIPTLNTFFCEDLAHGLRTQGRQADVFLANNVLAHVADLNGFVAGISLVLKPDGQAVIEAPYVLDLIDHCEFDTIYHQHLCYFSVSALRILFHRHGLNLNDVERTEIHGGSLRLFVSRAEDVSDRVKELVQLEEERGANKIDFYKKFAETVESLKSSVQELVARLKKENKKIAAYGAAAKGCTFLSAMGLDSEQLDYVVDLNPYKQGKYLDGCHLPIRDPDYLNEDKPDYLLILAWNFADEIIKQQEPFKNQGGQFIVPIPNPVIV